MSISGGEVLRIVLELLVLGSMYGWLVDLWIRWSQFTRRSRRISTWILALLAANGFAILTALTEARPVSVATWVLLTTFAGLNAAMVWHPDGDELTARQYAHLIPSWRFPRLHR